MDRETLAINAPVIGIVAGADHLQAVREAYKARKQEMRSQPQKSNGNARSAAMTAFKRPKI